MQSAALHSNTQNVLMWCLWATIGAFCQTAGAELDATGGLKGTSAQCQLRGRAEQTLNTERSSCRAMETQQCPDSSAGAEGVACLQGRA